MSDKVGLILDADQLRRERDEALRERDQARADTEVWRAARGYWHDLAVTHLQQRDEARTERDQARSAAREIVLSLEIVLEPEAAAKLWARAVTRYPWMKEPDERTS